MISTVFLFALLEKLVGLAMDAYTHIRHDVYNMEIRVYKFFDDGLRCGPESRYGIPFNRLRR